MEIQYVIINFIILLAILVIAGRKTVKRIFGGRLEKINKELDEAEAIEKMEMPIFESLPEEAFEEDFNEEDDEERKKRIAFTSATANSKDTPPCYLEESVKELEKTPVADALRIGQKNGEVKDGHPGILYVLFFRTACNIIVACNKNNIAIPEDEWFLSLVRK